MNFFLSPPEKTNWSMAASEFVDNLIRRWPAAKVRPTDNPELSPEWEVEVEDGTLEGEFYPRLSGVVFNGANDDGLATFVLWFRSLVPPEQPLLFYDDGFNVDLEVNPDTTASEIVSAINR